MSTTAPVFTETAELSDGPLTTIWHCDRPEPGQLFVVLRCDWSEDYRTRIVHEIKLVDDEHAAGAARMPGVPSVYADGVVNPRGPFGVDRLACSWEIEADAAQRDGTARGQLTARILRACAAELRDELSRG